MEDKKYLNKELDNYQDLLNREKDWKNKLILSYRHQFSFQEDLDELAFNFINNNKEKLINPDSVFKEVANYFLAKGLKTFRSIKYLTENGLGEDAAVLIRCQFELLTNFLYISKEDQDNRSKNYIYYSHILSRKYLNKIYLSNLFYEVYDRLSDERKEEINKNYEEHEKLYPNKRWWSGKSCEEMAKDIGLKDYYISIYCPFSNLVHSNIESSRYYVIENNNITRFIIAITDHLITQVIFSNCDFLLRILNQLNEIFQLGQDDCLQEALNRFCKAFPKELSKEHV